MSLIGILGLDVVFTKIIKKARILVKFYKYKTYGVVVSAINIALVDNLNKFTLLSISEGELSNKVLSTEEIEKESFQLLLYKQEMLEVAELSEILKKAANFCPLRSFEELELTKEDILKSEAAHLVALLSEASGSWALQNNVLLLENLFEYVDHYKKLWPNDRTAFFEELWFTVKKNLAATGLKLIYNDMKTTGKNQDKNELTQVVIDGQKYPNPVDGSDFEKNLMDHYHDEFGVAFNVSEYDQEKGQLVITAVINESPVILMAQVLGLTRLQSSVISTFIQALSR